MYYSFSLLGEPFLEHGIPDLSRSFSSQQVSLFQMNEGTQDLSPITENTDLSASQTVHHYYHISTPKRGSIRRLKHASHGKNESLKQEIYNMLLSLKDRKDLEEVPKQYNTIIKEYHRTINSLSLMK